MKKKVFYSEYAYIIGIAVLAFGTALLERADFGLSMVVAPAYLLHLKISQFLPFFSFGMAEYTVQLFLIILLSLGLRKFKISYLFSFVTAVIYGIMLDGCLMISNLIPNFFWVRILLYIVGLVFATCGISLLFHTYFAPEAYELVVKEISRVTGKKIMFIKTIYDISSLVISVALSFAFFGLWHFEGVRLGTLICACINGLMIGAFSGIFERYFEFQDRFTLRNLMEK